MEGHLMYPQLAECMTVAVQLLQAGLQVSVPELNLFCQAVLSKYSPGRGREYPEGRGHYLCSEPHQYADGCLGDIDLQLSA